MNLTDILGGTGTIGLGFVVVFFGLIVYFAIMGRRRPTGFLREIPAFRKLENSIGHSVESGQRLHMSFCWGGISGLEAGAAFIGLAVLHRIARVASISDRPPVATSGDGTLAILSRDTLRSTYDQIGASARYDPIYGQLTGLTPFSYAAGTLPLVYDKSVSSHMLAGHFGPEVALIADAGERRESLTIAGSDSLPAQAVLYATAQEPLIGEELYASGAYLQVGPLHTASIRAEDIARWGVVGFILFGVILKLAGVM